jgi:hypothetical protein
MREISGALKPLSRIVPHCLSQLVSINRLVGQIANVVDRVGSP